MKSLVSSTNAVAPSPTVSRLQVEVVPASCDTFVTRPSLMARNKRFVDRAMTVVALVISFVVWQTHSQPSAPCSLPQQNAVSGVKFEAHKF